MSLKPGDLVDDKYRIVALLGEGGMGAVYEGENTRIHRRVAIKVLHADVAASADAVQRFEREAQAAGRIGSQHICEVLDLGNLPNGDRYMVMEFLQGESLNDRIKRMGRILPEQLCPIVSQLLEALEAAHSAGIVHRDLKPDNVFLLDNRKVPDFVKVLDFGISKFSSANKEFSMTRTGVVMGTPYYMAPEQAKGNKGLDHRVDIYAVGVIMYEALTGHVPFDADTFNELLFKIALEDPKPLEEVAPEVDPAFAAVVRRAMARNRNERYASAAELRAELVPWIPQAMELGAATVQHPLTMRAEGAPPATTTVAATGVPTQVATVGAWSQSEPGVRRKSPLPMLLGLGAAAMLLLGGMAWGAWRLSVSSDQAQAAAAQAAAEREEAERKAAERVKQLAEAERLAASRQQKLEEERKKLNEVKTQQQLAQEAAEKRALEEKAKEEERAKQARAAAQRAARPAAPPKKQPEAKQPEPSSTGRKIRTSL